MPEINPELWPLLGLFAVAALVTGALLALSMARRGESRRLAELNALMEAENLRRDEQIEQLQQTGNELQQSLQDSEIQRSSLNTRFELLQEQERKLSIELAQSQTRVDTLREELATSQAQASRKQAQIEHSEQQLHKLQQESQSSRSELKSDLARAAEEMQALQQRYQTLMTDFAEQKTTLEERERSYRAQLAQFEDQKQALGKEFQLLANEILEKKSALMQETNRSSLSALINPFQQSLDGFKKEVQEIHHRETAQQGELRKELESLKELNQRITTEAHELSTALRGQKKLQGNWGELVLENVLDRSGLELGKDYVREKHIQSDEGRGRRPDAIVYLPSAKHLIIDAKVSLNAYTRYVNADGDAERALALAEHVQAVSARIDDLASKEYYNLPGLNSPDLVFMFVPIESAFVEALKADETLFQKAIERNVLVATPTTLLTSLNIVRQLWRYEEQNKHTAALASRAELVFKKLNTFLASFEGVKKGLDKALEAYNTAEGQLLSGRGNLVKQVGEFKKLAPSIKGELPAHLLEKAELEVDYVHPAGEPDPEPQEPEPETAPESKALHSD